MDPENYCARPCQHHPITAKYPSGNVVKHLKDWAEFLAEVTKGLRNVTFPRPQQRYTSVHVVLLSWAEDDLNTAADITRLQNIFQQTYNFSTHHFQIPSSDAPEYDLEAELVKAKRTHARSRESLLIIFYGGHGEVDRRTQHSIWKAWKFRPLHARTLLSPQIDWTELQGRVMDAKGDVLLILDCCYAARALNSLYPGRRELLLASGNTEEASNVNSFTKALVEELASLAGQACPVSTLHGCLLRHIPKLDPSPLFSCAGQREAGIVLVPLPKAQSTDGELPSEEKTRLGRRAWETQNRLQLRSECKVLVSVSLTKGAAMPLAETWTEWFQDHAPPEIAAVELGLMIRPEAMFEADSTLVLVSIPVNVWNAMPANPAISFISLVRSGNTFHEPLSPSELTKRIEASRREGSLESEGEDSLTSEGEESLASEGEPMLAVDLEMQIDHQASRLAKADINTPIEISGPSSAPSDAGNLEMESPTRETLAEVGDASLARRIVAQEMGVDISEISDSAELAEMGMDPLMSLAITGELREKTGIDLPSTFLATSPTIKQIEDALGMHTKPKTPAATRLAAINETDISKYPPATSVLLQGNPKVATKKIFFLPDASGSATSYVSIPNIGPDTCAYGLNCPFMKDPTEWECSVEINSVIYIAEIRRRQPTGPYILGGWSLGGVLAYAAAQALLAAGEGVEKLLLLDSPYPVNLDLRLADTYVFFYKKSLLTFGDLGKTLKWLLPHVTAAIRQLSDYNPKPTIEPIATLAIWCLEPVASNLHDLYWLLTKDEDSALMKWLLNRRTVFGDNGWGQLCGVEHMKFEVMGGNHFSMMKDPYAKELGLLIRGGISWNPQL